MKTHVILGIMLTSIWLKLLISITIIYCLLLITCYFLQQYFIYFPDRNVATPQQWQLPLMQEVNLKTNDGLNLIAWYQKANAHKPTLIYFHGNGGHLGYRAGQIQPYIKHGYGILLVSYRGYGGNTGSPSEQGFYQDARAAVQFLEQQGIPPSCRILYGESIGAAVAIQIAIECKIAALILQAPFNKLVEIAQYHYPIFPMNWILKERYASEEKISQTHAPILILQVSKDTIVPLKFSKKLYYKANQPKEYIQYEYMGHNNLDSQALFNDVNKFIEIHVKCKKETF